MHHIYYRHQENNHADLLPQRAPMNPNFPPFPPVAVDEAEKAGPPPRPTSPSDRSRTYSVRRHCGAFKFTSSSRVVCPGFIASLEGAPLCHHAERSRAISPLSLQCLEWASSFAPLGRMEGWALRLTEGAVAVDPCV